MDQEIQTSIHHIRGSVILLALRILGILFIADTAFAFILAFALFTIGSDYYASVVSVLWILHTVKFVIEAYLVLYLVVSWATITYYLTDHTLVYSRGVVKTEETFLELNKTKSVHLTESWLGKLMNYGTITLTIPSYGGNEQFSLIGIADPKKYERIFRTYLGEEY